MVCNNKISLTINWSAESNVVKADDSYFRNLCKSSIKGLRKGEEVYCFTEEQVTEIRRRVTFGIIVIVEEDYYRLRKKIC